MMKRGKSKRHGLIELAIVPNSKYNPKKDFNVIMNSITRKFMLERCKLYKVRHRSKEDSLVVLCKKYLNKLDRLKPWEIPEDENGNAGWINPNRTVEDEAIKLTYARVFNHPLEKFYEDCLMNYLKFFNNPVEGYRNFETLLKSYKET